MDCPGGLSPQNLVLMVEDDPGIADAVGDILQDLGYLVAVSRNSNEALEYLRSEEDAPALVFSDIMMPPGPTGLELAGVIAREFPEIPVILTTGYADKAALAEWSGLPILRKPYRITELSSAFSSALTSVVA